VEFVLKVSELFSRTEFRNLAELIAGKQGIDNEIRSITVMEAPDFPHWVNGGEFVLSTFFSVKDDVDKQVEIIHNLSEKQIAGLAIKVDRFIENIHPLVMEAAEALSLPLFKVDRETKFRDLIHIVSQELVRKQTDSFVEKELFYDMILNQVLRGESADLLCKEVADYIGYPCAILSPSRELIAGEIKRVGANQAADAPEGDAEVDGLLDEFAIREKLMDGSLEYRKGPYVVVGCSVKGDLISLLLFSAVDKWEEREQTIAKRAAYAIGYRFLENHLEKNVEERILSAFVDEVVFKGIDPKVFESRAHFFGWTIYDSYQAIIVRNVSQDSLSTNAFSLLADRWVRHIRTIFPSVLAVTKQDELIALISLPGQSKLTDMQVHKEKMTEMLSLMFYRSPLANHIRIGIGPIVSDPKHLQKSYLQARTLIDLMHNRAGMLWYVTNHLLELFLLQSKDQMECQLIREAVLDPIIACDLKHNTELLKSVKAFVQFDSIEEAAESLYVHSNTLRNRLNKVADLTGVNPNKTMGRMMYLIALIEHF